ncbi:hypothetical protein C4D60_Mb02t17680 [Musa balbisiana]|uniref:VOC domain-containing protein n=1 Tax=Musa balbisiana TaxID=52838 RepID=A0A4S8ICT8_MUSBA|nr:hypothetical protein C4D60_Mb02t17680 [Musa balbisiana]
MLGPSGGALPLASLNHISIVCRSVERSLDFYHNVLGFLPVRRPVSFDFDGAWLFNYGIGIHLLQSEDPENMPAKREINPKDNHISFQCESLALVEKKLREMGIPYIQSRVEEGGIYVDQMTIIAKNTCFRSTHIKVLVSELVIGKEEQGGRWIQSFCPKLQQHNNDAKNIASAAADKCGGEEDPSCGLRAQRLLGFGRWADLLVPRNPQQMKRGDGGSMPGETKLARKACRPPVLPLRAVVLLIDDAMLFECLSSLNSAAASSFLIRLRSPEKNLSSHTTPDDPDLRNVVTDLCSPAIALRRGVLHPSANK